MGTLKIRGGKLDRKRNRVRRASKSINELELLMARPGRPAVALADCAVPCSMLAWLSGLTAAAWHGRRPTRPWRPGSQEKGRAGE